MMRPMEILCSGQPEPKWQNQIIQSRTYREAFKKAKEQLDANDRQTIDRIIREYNTSATSNGKCVAIRNFGVAAIEELIGMLGIWMTQLNDQQFEQMLSDQKKRA